jgi:hypothetical protein
MRRPDPVLALVLALFAALAGYRLLVLPFDVDVPEAARLRAEPRAPLAATVHDLAGRVASLLPAPRRALAVPGPFEVVHEPRAPSPLGVPVGAALLLRGVSLLWSLATLVFVYACVRRLAPGPPGPARAAAAAWASLPAFATTAATVGPHALAGAAASGAFLLLIRGSAPLGAGAAAGLALLCGPENAFLLAPLATTLARRPRALGLALVAWAGVAAAGFGVSAALLGDPLPWAAGPDARPYPLNLRVAAAELARLVTSFFGGLPGTGFLAVQSLAAAAVIGLMRVRVPARGTLAAAALACLALVVARGLAAPPIDGRALHAAAPALAAGFVFGLGGALGVRPRGVYAIAAVVAALGLYTLHRETLPPFRTLRSKLAGPVLVYEDAGHPRLSRHLRAGDPTELPGSYGAGLDPVSSAAVAHGPVVFEFDGLPVDVPLRVRLTLHLNLDSMRKGDFPHQELWLNGRRVLGPIAPAHRARTIAAPVPERSPKLEVRAVPALGAVAAVSEVWIEREPVSVVGWSVGTEGVAPGGRVQARARVARVDGPGSEGVRLALEVEGSGVARGAPVDAWLPPGGGRDVELHLDVPADFPRGAARLRLLRAALPVPPFLAIRAPSLAAVEAARIGDREAGGLLAVASRGDQPQMLVDSVLPAVPAGDWEWALRWRTSAVAGARPLRMEVEDPPGSVAVLEPEAPGTKGWREDRLAWRTAGGAPRVRIRAQGAVALDSISLYPVLVDGVDLRVSPDEHALHVR